MVLLDIQIYYEYFLLISQVVQEKNSKGKYEQITSKSMSFLITLYPCIVLLINEEGLVKLDPHNQKTYP